MSGLEVVAAVAAVVSAFHGGAELLKLVKKKRQARKGRDQAQQEFEEEQLQQSLVTGEQQINLRYAQDTRELGEFMRVGDVVARDRLFHIALIMQAEIIKSLQLAATHDNAILNLKILHQTTISNKKETFVTLDELKQRILVTRPMARQLRVEPVGMRQQQSIGSVQTMRANDYSPVNTIPDNYIPSPLTLNSPDDAREAEHGLTEYFRTKRGRNPAPPATQTQPQHAAQATNVNFSAALEELIRSRPSEARSDILNEIQEMMGSYKDLSIKSQPSEPWDRSNYNAGGLERQDTLVRLNGADMYVPNPRGPDRDVTSMPNGYPISSGHYGTGNGQNHPAYSQNVFDAQREQQPYSQQYPAQSPYAHRPMQTQLQTPQPRWSDVSGNSSTNSDPASLNRNSSNSSQGSNTQPSPLQNNLSPNTDYHRFSPPSPLQNVPYQQYPEHPRSNLSSTSHYAPPVEMYTPPIPPYALQRAASQPDASMQANSRQDAPPNMRSSSQGETIAPVHTPWPGSTRDPSPMPPYSPSLNYPIPLEEDAHVYPPVRSPLRGVASSPPLPMARDTSSVHSARSESTRSEHTITPSGFAAVAAAASALTSAPLPGRRHPSVALSIASTDSSGSASIGILPGTRMRTNIRLGTIQSGPAGAERMMDGRPCKDNNYWGFCKGAWSIRENVSKGLTKRNQPSGYYNTKQIWECTACTFRGEMFSMPHPTKKNKMTEVVDQRIHISMAGIRYRWIFLAKSHVKQKPADTIAVESNYGCVICSAEDHVTGIYGGVETLMNHIALTHAADMSDKTRKKVNCVVGRRADPGEDFDINVPIFAQVEELAA